MKFGDDVTIMFAAEGAFGDTILINLFKIYLKVNISA